jgi:hypothetical protein
MDVTLVKFKSLVQNKIKHRIVIKLEERLMFSNKHVFEN